MPSPAAIEAAQGSTTDVVWHFLVTLTTPGNPPLRLTDNNEPVVSRGNTYEPFYMEITLPIQNADELPTVEIHFLHLSSEIIEEVRAFRQPPGITIELVTSITPDIVERTVDFAVLRNVTYDSMIISGRLDLQNVLTSSIPSESYSPQRFPGLFVT